MIVACRLRHCYDTTLSYLTYLNILLYSVSSSRPPRRLWSSARPASFGRLRRCVNNSRWTRLWMNSVSVSFLLLLCFYYLHSFIFVCRSPKTATSASSPSPVWTSHSSKSACMLAARTAWLSSWGLSPPSAPNAGQMCPAASSCPFEGCLIVVFVFCLWLLSLSSFCCVFSR